MRGRKLTDEEREISEQKMREYRNRKSRERYAYRKENHLCVHCAVPLTGDDPLMCPECREKTRKTNRATQQRRRDCLKEHGYLPEELPTFVHQDCFAYKSNEVDGCDALRELDCYNCAFYKRFDDGSNGRIRLDNYNGQCGLTQDEYGLALFYSRTSAENCFVRVNPGGSISISAPNGVYVNGTQIG